MLFFKIYLFDPFCLWIILTRHRKRNLPQSSHAAAAFFLQPSWLESIWKQSLRQMHCQAPREPIMGRKINPLREKPPITAHPKSKEERMPKGIYLATPSTVSPPPSLILPNTIVSTHTLLVLYLFLFSFLYLRLMAGNGQAINQNSPLTRWSHSTPFPAATVAPVIGKEEKEIDQSIGTSPLASNNPCSRGASSVSASRGHGNLQPSLFPYLLTKGILSWEQIDDTCHSKLH